MKNKYLFVLLLLAALSLLGFCFARGLRSYEEQEEEGLHIVTSFYPMQIAAMNVAGDQEGVTVECLSEPQTGCLHDYQLTPQDMILLSHADVFIVNGGGIESFLTEVAAEYPELLILNAGEEIFSEDAEEEQPHQAEDHHGENAHAWMSISHYKQQVERICQGLMEADSDHGAYYRQNCDTYLEKISRVERKAEEVKEQAKGVPVVIFHEAYEYLAQELGMQVEGLLNLDEERQVSAGETADIIRTIQDHQITLLLAEELYGRDLGEAVRQETGCRVYYLDTLVRGEVTEDAWLTGMQENLRTLQEALCAK